jgi:hypothetical protein
MIVLTVTPALQRLRKEDCKFKASLGCMVRPCLKPKIYSKEHQKDLVEHL